MDQEQRGDASAKQSGEQQMSDQAMINIGQEAAKVLQSPVYNTLYTIQLQSIFQEWMSTEPKEERRRESLFHQAKGLMDATQFMTEAAGRAQHLLDNQAKAQSAENRRAEYLDTQGFGLNY